MPTSDKSAYVQGVFTKIAPSYDLMNDLESLGLHRLWKDRLVRELSRPKPARILDIACGTGDIAIALARANPQAEVIGLDFCEEMLDVARTRAAQELPLSFKMELRSSDFPVQGTVLIPAEVLSHEGDKPAAPHASSNKNLSLIHGNAMDLPFDDDYFDAVSISFGLRNMPDYAAVLAEIHRVLKPTGQFRCLEASYPTNPMVKPPFKLYFKHWLPVLGKLIVDSPDEYSWLNTSTEAFLSKDELVSLMRKTGFGKVGYSSFLLGAAALHRGTA